MAKKEAKAKAKTEWTTPVEFHFRVDFQLKSEHFKASFMEVRGLNMTLDTKGKINDNGAHTRIPNGLSYGKITFKRALEPLSEPFTKWINECFSYLENKDRKLNTYDMVIKLLNKDGKPLAGWLGRHAYPIEWNLDGMNAMESKLSMESVTMACNSLKRLPNLP